MPQLNAFGKLFLAGGFNLEGARRASPVAVKVESAYSSTGNGDAGVPLPKAIVDEVEILSAGPIGRNASYWFEQYVVDGGLHGRPRDMYIDLRQTLGQASRGVEFHAKAGEFTLPLPVDPETQRPTLANYALFDQTVGANDFNLFEPRVGVDFYLTGASTGIQTHVVLLSQHDVMGTFSKAFGSGWNATAYRYQGVRNLGAPDRFFRQGYALAYDSGRFGAVALAQSGNDSNVDGAAATSSGGLVQAGWHFSSAASLYARYDATFNAFDGRLGAAIASLVMRPTHNTRFTLEGSRGSDRMYRLATGLLFAY
ncbi:MAG: hypothetical protein ABI282_04425 [Candidatus Baltobacteraceae bacterium]